LATVSTSDAETARIRATGAYRAAVWWSRLAVLVGLVFLGILLIARPSGPVIALIWLAGVPPSVASLVCLRRAGVRFLRWQPWQFEDPRFMWRLLRDMLWFRPS
jgi:hypothetical protein